jgi:hypothetical protein
VAKYLHRSGLHHPWSNLVKKSHALLTEHRLVEINFQTHLSVTASCKTIVVTSSQRRNFRQCAMTAQNSPYSGPQLHIFMEISTHDSIVRNASNIENSGNVGNKLQQGIRRNIRYIVDCISLLKEQSWQA